MLTQQVGYCRFFHLWLLGPNTQSYHGTRSSCVSSFIHCELRCRITNKWTNRL